MKIKKRTQKNTNIIRGGMSNILHNSLIPQIANSNIYLKINSVTEFKENYNIYRFIAKELMEINE